MTEQQKQALEQMIDLNSLGAVLRAVSEICREKAEHLRSNWQDELSAREWQLDANSIERTADRLRCEGNR